MCPPPAPSRILCLCLLLRYSSRLGSLLLNSTTKSSVKADRHQILFNVIPDGIADSFRLARGSGESAKHGGEGAVRVDDKHDNDRSETNLRYGAAWIGSINLDYN